MVNLSDRNVLNDWRIPLTLCTSLQVKTDVSAEILFLKFNLLTFQVLLRELLHMNSRQ